MSWNDRHNKLLKRLDRLLTCPICGARRVLDEKYLDWWTEILVCPVCGYEENKPND